MDDVPRSVAVLAAGSRMRTPLGALRSHRSPSNSRSTSRLSRSRREVWGRSEPPRADRNIRLAQGGSVSGRSWQLQRFADGESRQRRSLLRAQRNPIAPPTTTRYTVSGPSFRMSPGMAMTATIRSHPHPAIPMSAESGRRPSLSTRSPFVVVSPVTVAVAQRGVAYVVAVFPTARGEPGALEAQDDRERLAQTSEPSVAR